MVAEHREVVERRLEALQRVVEQQASALRCWCCGFVPRVMSILRLTGHSSVYRIRGGVRR